MYRILYEKDGTITGCFERPENCHAQEGQFTIDVELTDDEWSNVLDNTVINETLVRKTDQELSLIEQERALFDLRFERDNLISKTDWWVVSDRTPTQEQLNYRQELRDITNTFSSLNDDGFAWPEKP